MSNTDLVKKNMKDDTLAVIVLNVGDGDAIILRFPPKYGPNACGVVDCYNAEKTIAALENLKPEVLHFICSTHPHYDHNAGLRKLIKWCINKKIPIEQFWDSGFRHVSKTHYELIRLLRKYPDIRVSFPTSGYETSFNRVRLQVLNPSIHLKNRYDTFGTNINNASIVLKLEYPHKDIAQYYLSEEQATAKDLADEERVKQNTLILGADAQFDAWAHITAEFPELQATKNRGVLIDPKSVKHNPLRCQVLKIPHHMSKHGISLEVLEILRPSYTIASCSNNSHHGFPHEITVLSVKDIYRKKRSKRIFFTGHRKKGLCSGTLVVLFRGDKRKPLIYELGDSEKQNAPLLKGIFTELPDSIRNPFEDNVEYIKIPGGTYKFSVTEKMVAVPDLYFCKYPVTNKRYRRFISFLEGKESKLLEKLSLELYAEKLLKFSESIKGYEGYLGKDHEKWQDLLRSKYDDDERFKGDDQPVVGVSWYAARAYCFWLSCLETVINQGRKIEDVKQVADIYRLPMEEEWEWAAGGEPDGSIREYPWPEEKGQPNSNLANYEGNVNATTPVGRYPEGATPQGLMDMAGNVWEWAGNLYRRGEIWPAVRGGSWLDVNHYLRCSARNSLLPGGGIIVIGFRVVRAQS